MRLGAGLYAAHTQPGLESIAWSEIEQRVAGARPAGRRVAPQRAGMQLFFAPRPDALAALRTVEDLFAVVAYRPGIGLDRGSLETIRAAARDAPLVEAALSARARLRPGSHSGDRLKFRVVARLSGDHRFRRIDLQRAVERGITERGDHRWRLDEDPGALEFWATMLGDELIVAIRLTGEAMRHRDYKIEHRTASLRPAVAAAMGWLSDPRDDDVVLDPMCGAGTTLIERAHLGRYRLLLGGDRDEAALGAARINVGPRHKPIALLPWDAAALPLANASVSRIVSNLPWGRRSGSHSENARLYPRLLAEFRRVLRAEGVIVLLTGEGRLMRELLPRAQLQIAKAFNVTILGAHAILYVCRA